MWHPHGYHMAFFGSHLAWKKKKSRVWVCGCMCVVCCVLCVVCVGSVLKNGEKKCKVLKPTFFMLLTKGCIEIKCSPCRPCRNLMMPSL